MKSISFYFSFIPALILLKAPLGFSQTIYICDSESIILEGINYNGGNLQWQLSSDSINWINISGANQLELQINPNESNWYRLKINDPDCDSIYYTDVKYVEVVTFDSDIFINQNSSYCIGEPLQLLVNNFPGAEYNWSGVNGFTSNDQNPIVSDSVTLNYSGNYTLNIVLEGCTSETYQTQVVVNALPNQPSVQTDVFKCAGENVNLNATGNTGADFYWSGPLGFESFEASPLLTQNVDSTYTGTYLVYQIVESCTSVSATVNLVVDYPPVTPVLSGTNTGENHIEWSWNTNSNIVAYKYNTVNDFSTATDLGLNTSFFQAGLICNNMHSIFIWSYNSCGESAPLNISESTLPCSTQPCSSPGLTIGTQFGGGIIADVNFPSSCGYLISAEVDQSTGAPWGCYGTFVNSNGTNVGSGKSNTEAITNNCATSGIAARICDDLVLGGFSDWYLPSKDELNLLYTNLKQSNLGNFNSGYYWTSSEENNNEAWRQYFLNGAQSVTGKVPQWRVRCVRSY